MKPVFVLSLAGLALAAQSTVAQVPTPRGSDAESAAEKQLIGTWEGPYQSDQASPGGLRLVISKDTAWKAVLTVSTDQEVPTGEVTEFKVEGTRLSWVQEIMGMTCRSSGELVAGTLKGETACEQGGAVAITAGWMLLKK